MGGIIATMLLAMPVGRTEALSIASTDWPPYAGETLPDGGTLTPRVMKALRKLDHTVSVRFFPWRRTLLMGLHAQDYIGYFPEYDGPDVRQNCYLSIPIDQSPLGFATLKTTSFKWSEIKDLSHYRIGTVSGYVNEDRFDALAKKGEIPTENSNDDIGNLHKLMTTRIDAAIIDERVFEYLKRNRPEIKRVADQLVFQSHLLKTHPLYVCFRKTEQGRMQRDQFNLAYTSEH